MLCINVAESSKWFILNTNTSRRQKLYRQEKLLHGFKEGLNMVPEPLGIEASWQMRETKK